MAKLLRMSAFLLSQEEKHNLEVQTKALNAFAADDEMWQQLHIEESESFELNGENEENCDLALLERHFKKKMQTEFDRPIPAAGERYRHFKTGKTVEVIAIARHTETNELTVVYECGCGIFNRPLDMFMSETERTKYQDAEQKYRFEKVEDTEIDIVEAIKHCKQVARQQRVLSSANHEGIQSCLECADEHERLAGWLEELLEFRKGVKSEKE